MAETNPNGANQYKRDPRQLLFKKYYCSPKSETFGNAFQSAIKAGFSEEYASNITTQKTTWFSEIMADMEILDDSLEVLKETLHYDAVVDGNIDVGIAGLKLKAALFGAERLGKERYSLRNEITGEDGEPISWRVVRGKSEEPDVKSE